VAPSGVIVKCLAGCFAMIKETFIPSNRCASTPGEAWTRRPPTGERLQYAAAAEFVRDNFPRREKQKCLVVGSPLFEAHEIQSMGWNVTYFDIRDPGDGGLNFVQGDASAMPFDDESFDALSSTCVLSHVGTGRYGDSVVERGDEKALAHMARVLKPGSLATIMFGNVAAMDNTVMLGTCHRVYAISDCRRMLAEAPFEIEKTSFWSYARRCWYDDENGISKDLHGMPDYVSFLVRKC